MEPVRSSAILRSLHHSSDRRRARAGFLWGLGLFLLLQLAGGLLLDLFRLPCASPKRTRCSHDFGGSDPQVVSG